MVQLQLQLTMGVSIHTKNGAYGVSMPCSSLQEFRVMVLEAYITWIKDLLRIEFGGDMEYDEDEYEKVEELWEDEVAAETLKKKIDLKHLLSLLDADMVKGSARNARIDYEKFENTSRTSSL